MDAIKFQNEITDMLGNTPIAFLLKNIFQSKNQESKSYPSFIGRTCALLQRFASVIIIIQPRKTVFLG